MNKELLPLWSLYSRWGIKTINTTNKRSHSVLDGDSCGGKKNVKGAAVDGLYV